MHFLSKFSCLVIVLLLTSGMPRSHARQPDRYPSLLWEITGNGLQRPSYLFGTMHISNKMVFNLSDSFYAALKSVDAVAIELDPEYWQQDIPRLSRQGAAFRYYASTYFTDYLTERAYTEGDYTAGLREVLRTEPELNDALLYRSESSIDNFQEDTYLDLYIYQTGKKLGKQTTGVETFMGAQQKMVEAYVDMANDESKKQGSELSGRYGDLGQRIQDAYRRGDLDLLDSLNILTEPSKLFTRKFLYDRNVIQARAIDSIMRTRSLFAGVGAAHLPGKEGVIHLLRARGYTLRPVYMQDRNALQKEFIDTLRVPVLFRRQYLADSFISVSVPGQLNVTEDNSMFSKLHYADMGNGSYYLVSRVKTNILFNGYREREQLQLIDSLLYENIPGKITEKKTITRDGYPGFDIRNRTRKGDMQRYQILVTPGELLIFKMGGKGSYVYGPEADTFFASIRVQERAQKAGWQLFSPASGGFALRMPVKPRIYYALRGNDNLPVWKYEALDPVQGNSYVVFKKSLYSFDFIEPDTFGLSLAEESLYSADFTGQKIARTVSVYKGRPVVDVVFSVKGGDYIKARFLLHGVDYYMLAVRTADRNLDAGAFFNSFDIVPYRYPPAAAYADTSLKLRVQTPVYPLVDADVQDMLLYVKKKDKNIKPAATYRVMPEHGHANLISEATGEVVAINSFLYPRYFQVNDTSQFLRNLLYPDSSLVIARREYVNRPGSARGILLQLRDTASSRSIRKLMLMQGHRVLVAATVTDTATPESDFVRSVFASLRLDSVPASPALYDSKLQLFLGDYYSRDSVTRRLARSALPAVYFGAKGFPELKKALAPVNRSDKDYLDLKTNLIAKLGYCRDTAIAGQVTTLLQDIYDATADTALFQNEVLSALANLKQEKATLLFRELLLQDPPVFEAPEEYDDFLSVYNDSLKLAALLFPELMNLTQIEEYKEPVRRLLVDLVDSGFVTPEAYENYVGNIYFDAKQALKKLQRSTDIAAMVMESDEENGRSNYAGLDTVNNSLYYQEALLMPYYDKNQNLPVFFHKLLQTSDRQVRLNTALLMLRYGKPVPDSIWQVLAGDVQYSAYLYARLQRSGHAALFPVRYGSKEQLSASMMNAGMGAPDSLALLLQKELSYKGEKGTVYFYKYRTEKEGEWKMAINGLLQNKNRQVYNNGALFMITEKPLLTGVPLGEQLDRQLKRLMISSEDSGRAFYTQE